MERVERVVLVDERQRQLVAQAGVDRQVRSRRGTRPARSRRRASRAVLRRVRRRPAELRRQPEQEVGGGVAGDAAPVNVKSPFGRLTKAMNMCSRADVDAELERVRAARPGEVVGELEHLVEALDERLLRVAEAEEAGDRR